MAFILDFFEYSYFIREYANIALYDCSRTYSFILPTSQVFSCAGITKDAPQVSLLIFYFNLTGQFYVYFVTSVGANTPSPEMKISRVVHR